MKCVVFAQRKQKGQGALSRVIFTSVLSCFLVTVGDWVESLIVKNYRQKQIAFQAHCFIHVCWWLTHPGKWLKISIGISMLLLFVLIKCIYMYIYILSINLAGMSFCSWQTTMKHSSQQRNEGMSWCQPSQQFCSWEGRAGVSAAHKASDWLTGSKAEWFLTR